MALVNVLSLKIKPGLPGTRRLLRNRRSLKLKALDLDLVPAINVEVSAVRSKVVWTRMRLTTRGRFGRLLELLLLVDKL
jgi:hypothetical protein